MKTKFNYLVTDSNIWIDLLNGGLIDLFFKLPFSFFAPDFLKSYESIGVSWIALENKGLQFIGLDENEMSKLFELRQLLHQPSLADLASFMIAKKVGGILLTGDKNLSNFAVKSIEVHGFLWVMDRLVGYSIITNQEAYECLSLLLQDQKTRLPKNECEKRLKKWKVK